VNKFCIRSEAFQRKAKLYIFPQEAEGRRAVLDSSGGGRNTAGQEYAPIGCTKGNVEVEVGQVDELNQGSREAHRRRAIVDSV
jgi:hypothetical protein